jgi:phage terminase large subunit
MREVQNSIKDSVKQLLEDKIVHHYGENQSLFRITDNEISCSFTDSLFVFKGLQNHTARTLKSLEGFNRAWYEEAQTLSQTSIEMATPTFRGGAKQLFTWNPEDPDDPVDELFLPNWADKDPDFLLIEANYDSNPWFPDDLRRDMERDKRRDNDKYLHVWKGAYRRNSEARVFNNYQQLDFITPEDAMFQHGADWGFSVDPTVLVRAFTGRLVETGMIAADGLPLKKPVYDPDGMCLFIDYEAYQVGCKIEDTPALFDHLVPGQPNVARDWEIRADSARPETIAHMRDHDYPLIVKADKGAGSVKDGIEFMKNYDIYVHPRCKHTYDELNFYSYKVDPKTKAITSQLEDKKNHVIDALRYAVELLRKAGFTWYVG